ncbi:MAG: GH92 family glycosyl hydrolase [Bacteroidota bacterium]
MNRHREILKWSAGLLLGGWIGFGCAEEAEPSVPAPPPFEKVNWPEVNYPGENLTQYVDPFIGTGGHGHTFPGATLPFGMVQLSPDTRLEGWDGCSGYHYTNKVVYGFSHTHLSGTGVSDYGDILLMPVTGPPTFASGAGTAPDSGYASRFRKADEIAAPGYYRTRLSDYGIDVELTATERCGLHRYTATPEDSLHLILDLAHRDPVKEAALRIVDDRHIEGFRFSNAWAKDQRVFFAIEFSRPFVDQEVMGHDRSPSGDVVNGHHVVGRFTFPPVADGVLQVRCGISAVSIGGAWAALEQEMRTWDFAAVKAAANAAWNRQLNKIVVQGGSREQKVNFYTALYHTMIAPNLFSDVTGEYRGLDGANRKVNADEQYTVFSLWDTFRATHPLFTLIEQRRTGAFIRTLLRHYRDGGILPIWELSGNYTGCMIGYHAIPVIADAYLKGIREFDAELALAAMVHSARQDHLGLAPYRKNGFIGAGEEPESVSKTLEYAYDDWCIGEMARAMGKSTAAFPNGDPEAAFVDRAQFYLNLFDPETGFFRAKMNGGWQPGFDPREVNFNFTEANAWQYSMFVPQDIARLDALLKPHGGLEQRLDELFVAESATTGRDQADITGLIGQYAHGNEPSHHVAYLYNYVGAPAKTQARVRQIMEELYRPAPDGLSGNEDCGQMSAWYVLSALGFYPVTPGTDQYVLGSPLFPEATLYFENGKKFTIRAEGTDAGKRYWGDAVLNGQAHRKSYLRHGDLLAGGELVLEMSDTPVAAAEGLERPFTTPPEVRLAVVPYFSAARETFTDSLRVEIKSVDPEAEIRYFIGERYAADQVTLPYAGPLRLTETTTLFAFAEMPDGRRSAVVSATYHKVDDRRSLELFSEYANQYSAGGDAALIDYLRGGPNFRTGRWQGYRKDLEVVLDLGAVKKFSQVGAGFLQDIGSWIWLPREVTFAVSKDGESFAELGTVQPDVPDNDYTAVTRDLELNLAAATEGRYVRMRALNYGVCPAWHLGAGGATWVFADEIWVE